MNASCRRSNTTATLFEVQQGLDEYRRALDQAHRLALTDDQILDSYRWGRRGAGAADFDSRGVVIDSQTR
ncbi:hypothetical protein [Acidipropionibacterium jensenii]|uniref:hypothetical protein n=1 Tax=Acidipropionibacterium jensenii TaxID=1749 RepID=UPI00214C0AC5|nr:hypothetical protein [Acidipropionibacterium jensenii]